jgi:ankyrin repeat protein
VRFLVKSGAAVSVRDQEGRTPFHMVFYRGHLHVAKFLLDCGTNVDEYGRTPLYSASSSGKFDVVRFLIERGADIHNRDDNSSNPLHITSQNGHLDLVRMLVNNGIAVDIRNGAQKPLWPWHQTRGKSKSDASSSTEGPT